MTKCTQALKGASFAAQSSFEFHRLYRREVVAQFDGATLPPMQVAYCCARWICAWV